MIRHTRPGCMVSIHASAREATNCIANHAMINGFNPRLRTGGDPAPVPHRYPASFVSIHASAREATEIADRRKAAESFQSTPPHGRRRGLVESGIPTAGFNPRLRTGGDGVRLHSRWQCDCFNPRLRTGGDSLAKKALIYNHFRHSFREPTIFEL